MAEIVGVFATSHTPVLTNLPEAPELAIREDVYRHFRSIGEQISALQPDELVMISDDHLHNFFLDNLPAFCIGAAESYGGLVEDWLKVEHQVFAGDPELGAYLVDAAYEAGFDPSLSMELTLDHAFVTPVNLMGLVGKCPVVPIYINCVQPPLPRMQRCVDFGLALRQAILGWQKDVRVAVLATGGISHDVGTPTMGALNEEFDRSFLDLLEAGSPGPLVQYSSDNVHLAGNGAEEIRSWLVAHGLANCAGYSTHCYYPVQCWYTGIAVGSWKCAT